MVAIYPAFEKPIAGAASFGGYALNKALPLLDEAASRLSVPTLSSFIDPGAMFLELGEEDVVGISPPPVRWYSAEEGLRTVDALIEHLTAGGDAEPNATTVEELKRLRALLAESLAAGGGFHLMVDF